MFDVLYFEGEILENVMMNGSKVTENNFEHILYLLND